MHSNKEDVNLQIQNITAISEEVNATINELNEHANNLQEISSKLEGELKNFILE